MVWSKNKKNRYTPAYPSFAIKVGFKRVYILRTCFTDVLFDWSLHSLYRPDTSFNIHVHKHIHVHKMEKFH